MRGLVQGVGFRPTVWRHARNCDLLGDVRNDSDGVLIRVWGERSALESFVRSVQSDAPPLARIDSLERRALVEAPPREPFRIVASGQGIAHTGVVPDATACATCIEETLTPGSRRHEYPFTNCTHCGPRLTIVRAIPYDRHNTSMAPFGMCAACQAEYDDPRDRRFHAEPIACPDCGPRVWLEAPDGAPLAFAGEDAIRSARRMLHEGWILAVKGLGGFHLACDATHPRAVARLRDSKRRERKPFALMASNVGVIERYCSVSAQERALLESAIAPIVLCNADGRQRLPAAVAPGVATLGFMLPYTPLHHLLTQGLDRPLVLTSGNRAESPQCIGNAEARAELRNIADAFVQHDRDIVNRVDDSVTRVMAGAPRVLRRARGYAPASIPLPRGFEAAPAVLAMGAESKNAFCLVKDGQAILAPHQGDLEDARTLQEYRRNLALYRELFDHDAQLIAADLHPDYLSTKLGREFADRASLPVTLVQHHHAHVASCLAENGVALDAAPMLGIALDGLGMGNDGELWGGEFLVADYRGFRRVARFRPVALLGGAQAMREPWRNTYAHIDAAIGASRFREQYAHLELAQWLARRETATLDAMLLHGIRSPLASSCGRLFDAVAAAIGICRERTSYEGQAAIELEALASGYGAYAFDIRDSADDLAMIDAGPMWRTLLDDLSHDVPAHAIAARFHHGLADAIVAMAARRAAACGTRTVALTGGCFQNRIVLERVSTELRAHGYAVLTHAGVPAGDGGLALGQAVIAAARAIANGGSPCA